MSDPFELATGTVNQVLTLSTAIITLGFVYFKDIASQFSQRLKLLKAAVMLQLGSIFFGALTLMAITGVANKLNENPDGIFSPGIVVFAFGQFGCFFIGLLCMCVAILTAASKR